MSPRYLWVHIHPFSGEHPRVRGVPVAYRYEVRDGEVRVYDDVGGVFTSCHMLTRLQRDFILAQAATAGPDTVQDEPWQRYARSVWPPPA